MAHNPRPQLDHPAGDELVLTAVLHALSDPTRLTIVRTLHDEADGRACGTFPVDVAPSTLSHHFKVLRDAGVIFQEDHGTRRWTTLRLDDLNANFPGLLEAVASRK